MTLGWNQRRIQDQAVGQEGISGVDHLSPDAELLYRKTSHAEGEKEGGMRAWVGGRTPHVPRTQQATVDILHTDAWKKTHCASSQVTELFYYTSEVLQVILNTIQFISIR